MIRRQQPCEDWGRGWGGEGGFQEEKPSKAPSQADLGQSRPREKATVAGMQ